VERAVITHAHSDHARYGNKHYLCHHDSVPLLQLRLGQDISVQGVAFGEKIRYNGVTMSMHPAGHIIGSAQIRIEQENEVWVVSGDYKVENDGISGQFEPVPCHSLRNAPSVCRSITGSCRALSSAISGSGYRTTRQPARTACCWVTAWEKPNGCCTT
jgi:mRNA degradation ribonuclease J1/J2